VIDGCDRGLRWCSVLLCNDQAGASSMGRLARMAGPVFSVVAATVDPAHVEQLTAAYQAVLDAGVPDGVLASALLRGEGNQWQITTLWRDRAAVEAMRARMLADPELPAAPGVFREVGAEPTLAVFDVVNARRGRRG
jgi:hypothetical protein